MEVDLILKIAGIGILVTIVHQILTRAGREDMATMTTLAGVIIVLLMIIDLINQLFANVRSVFMLS